MKLLHPKVIHQLTTAYYNSLYRTSAFIRLYITGLFVVTYRCNMVVAIAEVVPLTPLHPVLIDFSKQVRSQVECKQWDFCYGCFCITYGWVTAVTCMSGLHFRNHLELWVYIWRVLVLSWLTGAQCMRLYFSLDATDRMLTATKACEGHAIFWKHYKYLFHCYHHCLIAKTNYLIFTVCVRCIIAFLTLWKILN